MKRKTLFGLWMLFLCISVGDAQGTPTFSSRILVSGDGARVVFEHSPHEETSVPIEIYDSQSKRKIGQISAARHLSSAPHYEGDTRFEYEKLRVEAVSTDGRYLLIRRLPLSEPSQTPRQLGYDPDDEAYLEAWNIVQTPRLKWRKRGLRFSDVKWVKEKIVVLFQKEVQRWNERGEVSSRLPFSSPTFNSLSPDGSRVVLGTDPPSVVETKNGRVIQKLNLQWPEQPVDFMFGPNNRFIWGLSYSGGGDGFLPWDHTWMWRVGDGKSYDGRGDTPIFSPDGSALWDESKRRFKSIATGNVTPLRPPAPFAKGIAFLQVISDDGRVWAGLNRQGEPFWVTTR